MQPQFAAGVFRHRRGFQRMTTRAPLTGRLVHGSQICVVPVALGQSQPRTTESHGLPGSADHEYMVPSRDPALPALPLILCRNRLDYLRISRRRITSR